MSPMPDATTTVAALKEKMRRFAAERSWEPYHSPKNLAMALAAEAAELMEHFLWVDAPGSHALARDPDRPVWKVDMPDGSTADFLHSSYDILGPTAYAALALQLGLPGYGKPKQ